MAFPSRYTAPASGLSIRASAFSSVDFPHAFGPTITVNDPSGTETPRSLATTASS